MSSEYSQKSLSSNHDEVEKYQNYYLRELNALSKIFITLSVAILGLTLSVLGPVLSQKIAGNWFLYTWFLLLLTAILGFFEIYSFSKRFRAKAEYLHGCMMADAIIELKGSDEKLEDFLNKVHNANDVFDRSYNWCVRIVAFQAFTLLGGIICLSTFVYKNFVIYFPVG